MTSPVPVPLNVEPIVRNAASLMAVNGQVLDCATMIEPVPPRERKEALAGVRMAGGLATVTVSVLELFAKTGSIPGKLTKAVFEICVPSVSPQAIATVNAKFTVSFTAMAVDLVQLTTPPPVTPQAHRAGLFMDTKFKPEGNMSDQYTSVAFDGPRFVTVML